jgi:quinol monooxygenase YgiN
MHGVLIKFDCGASAEELEEPFTQYAQALQQQPGLINKAWIATDNGYGGFHVFADRAAADYYLGSELAAGLMATDGFDNFQVQHFDVLDKLSAMTGVRPIAA